MGFIVRVFETGLLVWFALFAAIVLGRVLTGRIDTTGLLQHGDGAVAPERVVPLIAFPVVLANYVFSALHADMSAHAALPHLSQTAVLLLTGGSGLISPARSLAPDHGGHRASANHHVDQLRGELYVINGPVYPNGNDTITISATANRCNNEIVLNPPPRKSICRGKDQCDDGVIVPSAMFKLIYDPNMQRANVFLMSNINHRKAAGFSNSIDYIKKFQVTVQALEQATNLQFFHELPLNRRRPIEQECAAVMEH